MVVRRVHFLIVTIYCVLIFGQTIAQKKDGEENPTSLDKYDFSQYISTTGSSHRI